MRTLRPSLLAHTVLVGALALGACDNHDRADFEMKRLEAENTLTTVQENIAALEKTTLPAQRKQLAASALTEAQDSLVAALRWADREKQEGQGSDLFGALAEQLRQTTYDANRKLGRANSNAQSYKRAEELVTTADSLLKNGIPAGADKKAVLALRDTAATIARSQYNRAEEETLSGLSQRVGIWNDLARISAEATKIYATIKAEARTTEAKDHVEKAYAAVQQTMPAGNRYETHKAEDSLRSLDILIRSHYVVEAERIWEKLTYDGKTNTATMHYFVEGKTVFQPGSDGYPKFADEHVTFEISRDAFEHLEQRGYTVHANENGPKVIVGAKPVGAINPVRVPHTNANK